MLLRDAKMHTVCPLTTNGIPAVDKPLVPNMILSKKHRNMHDHEPAT